jgi:IS1 family transposase
MNRLDLKRRVQIVSALVEGVGIRATCRMVGCTKGAVTKLIADLGPACMEYHDRVVRGVRSERVQCDELWSFVLAKQKNLRPGLRGQRGVGSVWTWTALDSDSKLLISYHVGDRGLDDARVFMGDLAGRLATRTQLSTDAHGAYLSAVLESFPYFGSAGVNYGQLLKVYGPSGNDNSAETRYSPGRLIRVEKRAVWGVPDEKHISTSHVERMNLSIRMGLRRYTRLTNGHSKKIQNHVAALAIYFQFYNFARIHQTIRVTPAMKAGIADHVWDVEEIVGLLERAEAA